MLRVREVGAGAYEGGSVTPESREFTEWRRDMEDAEAFKANPHPYKRQFVPPPQIREIDPRDRD